MKELKMFSNQIRYTIMDELECAGFGHYGGSLSIVELLAVLYGEVIDATPENVNNIDRDYVVLSKGHSGPGLYATLALKGFFPMDWLKTLNKNGTNLPSHPDKNLTPGVDVTTGSLGQGVSVATGIAYGKKAIHSKGNVFAIVGDGELNEGQAWEAIQFASAKKLDNFILYIDWNKKQNDGWSDEVSKSGTFEEKLNSFGFFTQMVDGASVEEILSATHKALRVHDRPACIVLNTTKGQGIKFLENMENNHHIRPDESMMKELKKAKEELKALLD
ncbi:transketolase [Allofustis seminis]|uniref:transketolase n=1 Tax=Allofustis seminis TaxID=166939 RepID=UPI000362D207|nr:transketolase [Allofustis seminis]